MKYLLMRAALTAAALAGILGVPSGANAQSQLPSYATTGDESIKGTIAGLNGKYDVTVRDTRGFVDNVRLHDGTIINPTGLQLAPGETVTVFGHNDGARFSANEIDTPYHQTYAYGVAPFYGSPFYGPYPYYGYGYGYGPFFGPRFGFGVHIR